MKSLEARKRLRFPVNGDMIKVSLMSQNERLRSEESIGWRIETFDTCGYSISHTLRIYSATEILI